MNDVLLLLVKQALSTTRFDLGNEKKLQHQIEEKLKNAMIEHRREVSLSKESIIDFLVGDIGIEIKIKGSAKAIYRQCERYCAFDEIKALVLLTNKIMRLPAQINNKNTYVINLGKAWL